VSINSTTGSDVIRCQCLQGAANRQSRYAGRQESKLDRLFGASSRVVLGVWEIILEPAEEERKCVQCHPAWPLCVLIISKVKLSLCLTKHYAIKSVWWSVCRDPQFLDLGTSCNKWSALHPDRFTPGERAPVTHWIGGWVGPRTGLDDLEKRKFLTLPGLEPLTLGRPARSQSLYRLRYPCSLLITSINLKSKVKSSMCLIDWAPSHEDVLGARSDSIQTTSFRITRILRTLRR
jgi:hypothetical protein